MLLPDLRSLWAPLLYRSPGNISVWHQSPLPPKKVTHAWVSLPLHLLPAEVWGNFLQVVHGEGEEARRLHCSLWYCQGRVMALCSSSHCGLTECDFGPVFLCITSTVSKKGMAKGLRERKGKPSGREKTNSDMSSEHVCEVPPTSIRQRQRCSRREDKNFIAKAWVRTLPGSVSTGSGDFSAWDYGGVSGKRAVSAVITRFIAPDVANSIGDYKVV